MSASITASDGYVLHYRRWDPEGPPVATLVVFNGVMSHSGWFFPLVPRFLEAGFRVVGADRRGTGANTVARGDAPDADTVVDDAVRIIAVERLEDRPLVLFAWCWGSVLALNVVAKIDVDGLVLVTPGLFPTAEVSKNAKDADAEAAGAAEDVACVAAPITDEMFTTGPHLDDFIRQDEHRLRTITPRFAKIIRRLAMLAAARLRKLEVPVLAVLATNDAATDNTKARAALEKLANVRIVELESAHGMQFDAPEALTKATIDFVATR